MNRKIKIETLTKETAQSVNSTIAEFIGSSDEKNEVELDFVNCSSGSINSALEIIQSINNTPVDLITHAHGKIGAAATILFSAGKPGKRTADMDTMLVLNDEESQKLGRFRNVKNPNAGLIEHLLTITTGKKRPIREAVTTMHVLTVYDAKKIGIVDQIIGISSKYEELLKAKKKQGTKDEKTTDQVSQ
jgi:ATP-dependent protease ClpP protease subunit